jgi:hypothetical protein
MNNLSTFIFKPSKTIIFSNKTRNNINSIEPYKYKAHSLSKQQKIFNTISPVRPFNRFIRQKIYGTGEDPSSAFIHFMNKDGEKPYKKTISPIITEGIKKAIKNNKWSLGTTYITNKKEYLPKIDPYKEYCFTERDEDDKSGVTAGNVVNPPTKERYNTLEVYKNINDKYPFKKMKEQFNSSYESNSFWKPYINRNDKNFNRSSVTYNIINNKDNAIFGKKEISVLEKSIHNKRKGLCEFLHLQRVYEPNYSQKYKRFLKENKEGFMKYKGVFTELYDSYNKSGNIYKPFLIEENNKKKPRKTRNNLQAIVY